MVDVDAPVDAVAVTFQAQLWEGIQLTLDPWTWSRSSWSTSVWFLPEPIPATRGTVLRVTIADYVPLF